MRETDHMFYPILAAAISVTGLSGFWFTYFSPMISGSYPPAGAPLHIHGWSFIAWYVLLPLQVLLASRRNQKHELLGRISVILVLFMTLTGLLVLAVRMDEAVRMGEPQIWLMYGPLILTNLVLFVVFYGAGIRMALTRRFDAHKRLMIVASSIGIGAGFFRLILFLSGFHPLSLPIGMFACSLFIFAGIVYDVITRQSPHPVYLVGLAAFLVVMVPVLPQVSESNVAIVTGWLAALGEQLGFLYDPDPTVEF